MRVAQNLAPDPQSFRDQTLGFGGIGEVHVGRLVRLEIDAATAEEAQERAVSMCRQLLANPVTEDFDVQVLEGAGSAR